jgi:hypothetical protein
MSVLGSFLLFQIQVLTVLTRDFSMSLPFLKGGMLDYVAMDIDPPYQTASLGKDQLRCLIPGFPWWDGPSGAGGFSEVLLLVCE